MARRRRLLKRQLGPLPGYPWEGKFQTVEEIRHYLDQTKLVCLLCGREFALLSQHLRMTHDMEADRYKEMYGLRWTTALAGVDHREAMGQRLRRTRALGKISPSPSPEHIKKLRRAALHRRPKVEADRKAWISRLRPAGGRQRVVNAPERMEEYLRRIATGRTPNEVGRDDDTPDFRYFYQHCSENHDYRRRFEAIWDQLPFAVQVRGHRTGPRFRKTVIALRAEGKMWAEIGRIMGVREGTVRDAWHRWKKSDNEAAEFFVRPDSLPLPVLSSTGTGS